MTKKRYFKRMWEEEFYIFDSNTISESDFEEKLEYEDYKAFEDSMMGDEVVNRLNALHEENEQLKQDKFICLDCEHSGYTEIGCLCEKKDHWTDYKTECEDYEELK